ncbi:OX-2 membrane glycoprotein-like isoform X2 [Cottoperca gobio]|uniref:OX-2 membrane glycoprotein-like isoform X2 n=1 Tax=Cottoperca gobio TaxID=56716 RepID=A0A6J2RA03_COTGO|nr:OX-2 membrane glycoprotein-like isoform X2 [Cottoperca gobio]
MLLILILTGLLFKASSSQITGSGNTTADYGRDAHYACAVANPTGVLQVTWQRLFNDQSIVNLATYNEQFGQQVNNPYRGKVIFTEATLGSTSITLANVTWGDESCYICSFNVYPEGTQRKQTCLKVQGISKFKTEVHVTSTEDEEEDYVKAVFSCSATGKPAPTIQWDVSPGTIHTHQLQTTIARNGDRTFTSSSNITLKIHPEWEGHVDCLLNTGVIGQRRERMIYLPVLKEEEETGKGLSSSGIVLVITAVMLISFIVIVAVMRRARLNGSRRNENDTKICISFLHLNF